VTEARAKALGFEFRLKEGTPEQIVRVEFEFKAEGELKNYARVDLETRDHAKFVMSTPLREERSSTGRIVISFASDRAHLEKLTLRVLVGHPSDLSGYDLRVKDFVAPASAKAADKPSVPTPKAPAAAK
jgi:hypothetical protein